MSRLIAVLLNVIMLSISFLCYDECHYAEYLIFSVMLSVIMMLSVVMLSTVAPISPY